MITRAAPLFVTLAGMALVVGGCAVEGEWSPTRTIAANVEIDNGESLNGVSLNGVALNGVSLNGVSLNGVSLNGVSLNGASLNGVSLNGASLSGVSINGTTLTGSALVGAQFSASLRTGASLPLRIDDVTTSDDLTFYKVSYSSSAGWTPLCLNSGGQSGEAIALSGRWDPRQGVPGGGAFLDEPSTLTFACRGYALAKCVELGYQPWATRNGVALRSYHQACTRALRADYCGDGASWTFDGWKLDVSDSLGIQNKVADNGTWVFEGAWSAEGALCLNRYRAAEMVASGALPSCILAKVTSTCARQPPASLLRNAYNTMSVQAPVAAVSGRATPGGSLQRGCATIEAKTQSAADRIALDTDSERLKAMDEIKEAVDQLKKLIDSGLLDPAFGVELLRRYVSAPRELATFHLKQARASATANLSEIAKSIVSLGDAEVKIAIGKWTHAVDAFKSALDRAQRAR